MRARGHAAPRTAPAAVLLRAVLLGALLLPAVLLPGAALPAADAQLLSMGVVGASPENELLLAAAVNAAGRAGVVGRAGVEDVAFAEPREPLAAPAYVCAQAAAGVQLAVGGAGGAEAAARVGLTLLLAEPAPPRRALPAALELYPHAAALAQACADLCSAKGWTEAVLLHEGSAGVAPLLAPDHERLALRARQLPPAHDGDALRNLLLVLKKLGATKFIVWCEAECSVRVLSAAQRVGLLAARHSYLLPALDLHTLPLADYSYGGANVTSLQLFEPESAAVRAAMAAWKEEYTALLNGDVDEEKISQIATSPPTAVLLAYDAARVAAEAARHLALPARPAGSCAAGAAAFHADSLLNYIRSREWAGVTGPASWEGGARRDVALHVAELQRGGRLAAAGGWSARGGLAWRARAAGPPPPADLMANRTFVVLIAKNDPYVMQQQSADRLSGNARYEGFCIELIERLAALLHFNYTFVEQPDGAYGSRDKTTGQWNGMLRRIMDDENVHFAITDLTITAEREEVVDFTTPFMNLGISILFGKSKPPEPELLAFLLPFSNVVWLCLGLAYVGTSLVLFVVGRLCPEEWQNAYPCIEEPPALENQFTLSNALWFNLGAVLLQGSEIAPVAYGSRAVASVWWLFALVITSSYTANLATLLSTRTSTELIGGVRDLADNDKGIEYGAKEGGSTYTFFELSTNELYRRMYQTMKEQKMPKNNDEGIQRVMGGQYAFFAESTTIEYTTERNCEVTRVGDPLDSKGYGIAMKKNSTYRHALNLALLKLQESGELRAMKYRWWKEMRGGGACKEPDEYETEGLSMANFMGLFLVLVVGCALGVVVSCCDLAHAAWRHPRDPDRSFAANFLSELRFVFDFERSEKPVRGPLAAPAPAPASASASASASPAASASAAARLEPAAGGRESRARSASGRAGARRSSLHAASLRLARHAASPAPR